MFPRPRRVRQRPPLAPFCTSTTRRRRVGRFPSCGLIVLPLLAVFSLTLDQGLHRPSAMRRRRRREPVGDRGRLAPFGTPSFPRMWETWTLAVLTLMTSASATRGPCSRGRRGPGPRPRAAQAENLRDALLLVSTRSGGARSSRARCARSSSSRPSGFAAIRSATAYASAEGSCLDPRRSAATSASASRQRQ